MDAELLALTRELLARAELVRRHEWRASPPEAPAPPRDPLPAGKPASENKVPAAPPAPESEPPAEAPAADPAKPSSTTDAAARLAHLEREAEECRACPLGGQRLRSVFGVGSAEAKVMFIGEGPGFEEDRRGEPFVGKAGQLLDKILGAIGLSRSTVYICNIVKCHPMRDPTRPDRRGNDRPPTPEEMSACRRFLNEQIALVAPKIIVALGATASRALTGDGRGITRTRGQWFKGPSGIPVIPTYHPAALLHDPSKKRDVWTDMKNLRSALEAQ